MDEKIKSLPSRDPAVVGAKHIIQHLDEEKPEGVENEAVEQVAFADRMLVNKCDLVDEEYLGVVESRLREINRDAPLIRSTNSVVPLRKILGIGGFDLDRHLNIDPDFLPKEEEEAEEKSDHGHGHGHGHGMATGMATGTLTARVGLRTAASASQERPSS